MSEGRSQSGMIRAANLLALVLAAGGISVLAMVFKPQPPPEAIEVASSQQCMECHPGVAAEWQASHHGFAFENPEVRKLSQDFRNEECLACHAPRPVLAFAPGERVLARNSERKLGVDCLACHALPSGGVATANPNPRKNAPCRPQTVTRMADVNHCAACHNQHKTVDQWKTSPPELRGQNCLHCHMPPVFRGGGRRGFDHSFNASHDPDSLRAAVRLFGSWSGDQVEYGVENYGAAHNFPTDERSRAADMQYRWHLVGEEPGAWQQRYRFRDPYRDEVDLTNTQLPSGESWKETLTAPPQAEALEFRLLYKTNPYMTDEDAVVVESMLLKP
ncbi:MAG: hypothetical protein DWQ01_02990 [Planctomycetota bacterium]|nr:MAG: hypothetical protein DWQ01_02990 [Planctomycetota bacterium]